MEVAVSRPQRTRTQSLSPDDFADIAPCESVSWGDDGGLVVTFASDLTPAQALAVRIRCVSADAAEEANLTAAAQAHQANQTFLALTAPTTSQSLAQVAALTRQMQGVLRFIARI